MRPEGSSLHKNPSFFPILSQMNPVHKLPPYFYTAHLSYHLSIEVPSVRVFQVFPPKFYSHFSSLPYLLHTRPSHLTRFGEPDLYLATSVVMKIIMRNPQQSSVTLSSLGSSSSSPVSGRLLWAPFQFMSCLSVQKPCHCWSGYSPASHFGYLGSIPGQGQVPSWYFGFPCQCFSTDRVLHAHCRLGLLQWAHWWWAHQMYSFAYVPTN